MSKVFMTFLQNTILLKVPNKSLILFRLHQSTILKSITPFLISKIMTELTTQPKPYSTGTPLQRHVSFWDHSNKGIVYPLQAYSGFRSLGFNFLISILSTLAFHVLDVGHPTNPGLIPDLRFCGLRREGS